MRSTGRVRSFSFLVGIAIRVSRATDATAIDDGVTVSPSKRGGSLAMTARQIGAEHEHGWRGARQLLLDPGPGFFGSILSNARAAFLSPLCAQAAPDLERGMVMRSCAPSTIASSWSSIRVRPSVRERPMDDTFGSPYLAGSSLNRAVTYCCQSLSNADASISTPMRHVKPSTLERSACLTAIEPYTLALLATSYRFPYCSHGATR